MDNTHVEMEEPAELLSYYQKLFPTEPLSNRLAFLTFAEYLLQSHAVIDRQKLHEGLKLMFGRMAVKEVVDIFNAMSREQRTEVFFNTDMNTIELPAVANPPCKFLQDELKQRGISETEFLDQMNRFKDNVVLNLAVLHNPAQGWSADDIKRVVTTLSVLGRGPAVPEILWVHLVRAFSLFHSHRRNTQGYHALQKEIPAPELAPAIPIEEE